MNEMEHKTKYPRFTTRAKLYFCLKYLSLIRRCKVTSTSISLQVFRTSSLRLEIFHYLCNILNICNMIRDFFSVRAKIRPSRLLPEYSRVQFIVRLAHSGKTASYTIPFIVRTDEARKFDSLTNPKNIQDYDNGTWVILRSWMLDVCDAVKDLMKDPDRISGKSIKARARHYATLRLNDERDYLGSTYFDPKTYNAMEGVSK